MQTEVRGLHFPMKSLILEVSITCASDRELNNLVKMVCVLKILLRLDNLFDDNF